MYAVWGKVMFILENVCLSTGGYLPWMEIPNLDRGYLPWMGVHTLNCQGYLPWTGNTCPEWWGTYLGQGVLTLDESTYLRWRVPTLDGGTPSQHRKRHPLDGVPLSCQAVGVTPPIGLDGGTPIGLNEGALLLDWMEVTPCQAGWDTPILGCITSPDVGLQDGWYASCIHEGGLSCLY